MVKDILCFLKGKGIRFEYLGEHNLYITSFSSLNYIKNNSVVWVKDVSNYNINQITEKVLIVANTRERAYPNHNFIVCENSKMVFFEILNEFFYDKPLQRICSDAIVETKHIGKNVSIGHNCFIGEDVILKDGVIIKNNVQIECPTVVGENTVIGSGVVIGTDGFGYYEDSKGYYKKVPHFGGVQIGKCVEIGANSCIDRGTIEDTRIEDNVKIDNLCHIAHNVHIGENSLVIALSLLGGSCDLKKNSYIAPGCLIKNQVKIGENSFVGMGSVVLKDVDDKKTVVGVPAKILRDN